MSASSSSRIDPAIGHLAALGQSLVDERSDVLSVLGQVADPRKRRGVRHTLPVILGVVVCAVLAGARSFVAIAEWAADADDRDAATGRRYRVSRATPAPRSPEGHFRGDRGAASARSYGWRTSPGVVCCPSGSAFARRMRRKTMCRIEQCPPGLKLPDLAPSPEETSSPGDTPSRECVPTSSGLR